MRTKEERKQFMNDTNAQDNSLSLKMISLDESMRGGKPLIATKIVDTTRSMNYPGRFLKIDSKGGWNEIDINKPREPREKANQALREGASEIGDIYQGTSSNSSSETHLVHSESAQQTLNIVSSEDETSCSSTSSQGRTKAGASSQPHRDIIQKRVERKSKCHESELDISSGTVSTQSSQSTLNSTKSSKSVKFGHVTLRDYGMVLGDHPNCSYGAPVTLDWDYLEYDPVHIDDYEYHQPQRRTLRMMILSHYKRKNLILKCAQHSKEDFKAAVKEVKQTKMQRSMTKTFLPLSKVEDGIESTCRKLKRAVRSKSKK